MKKALLLIIVSLMLLSNGTISYSPTSSDRVLINKLVNSINKKYSDKTIAQKNQIKELLYKTLEQNKNNSSFEYILTQTLIKLNFYDYKEEYINHYTNYNIDFYNIKETWLWWHNYERGNLNLSYLSFDYRLDNTSYQWSKTQYEKGYMTHERTSWDWYYNYPIIEQWFQDRLVKCNVSWWVTSSESIAKYGYYCHDNNCNDELTESLKEIFLIYMDEKWLSYPANAHYKSIIHSNLWKVWMWLYIYETDEDDYYEYYVTTHYCSSFSDN